MHHEYAKATVIASASDHSIVVYIIYLVCFVHSIACMFYLLDGTCTDPIVVNFVCVCVCVMFCTVLPSGCMTRASTTLRCQT
jgi:hypothetical protein